MVLGTSEVRLIDMTRAFASIGAKGVMVVPYAIQKVTAPGNRLLYQRELPDARVLVAPWVAAEMTDLLQTAVNVGTARVAQIGRPVAGKTGTTSSNKDGWFLGFSSGLTTGVWMGRDDGRPVPGLQGGHAPAQAFADFMRQAVASRPAEAFDTQVTLPEWQVEPDDEAYYGDPDSNDPAADQGGPADGAGQFVDPDGMPVDQSQRPARGADGDPGVPPEQRGDGQRDDGQAPPPAQKLDQSWLNGVLGRSGRGGQP